LLAQQFGGRRTGFLLDQTCRCDFFNSAILACSRANSAFDCLFVFLEAALRTQPLTSPLSVFQPLLFGGGLLSVFRQARWSAFNAAFGYGIKLAPLRLLRFFSSLQRHHRARFERPFCESALARGRGVPVLRLRRFGCLG
jgi:hypothetical protein